MFKIIYKIEEYTPPNNMLLYILDLLFKRKSTKVKPVYVHIWNSDENDSRAILDKLN